MAWWAIRSGETTRTVKIETGLHAFTVSPDGLTAAVGIKDGLQLVDLPSGTVRTEGGGSREAGLAAVQPGRQNPRVDEPRRYRDPLGRQVGGSFDTLRGHSNSVQQPAFSSDGETLYTASHDGSAIAWDLTGDRGLGRPFTFTNDGRFSSTGFDGHPGELSSTAG